MTQIFNIISTYVSSGGEHKGVYDVVLHHITDHIVTDGIIGQATAWLNNTFFSQKLFGIFDMRITKWVLMMWLTAFLMLIIFIPLARSIKSAQMGSRSRWVNFWESFIGFIHDEIVEPNFHGKHTRMAMPYFLTLFFFILFANLLGLIPNLATSTGNLAVTGGLAVCTLFGMFGIGMIMQGPLWVFTGIVPKGVPIGVVPLLWVIEFVSLFIKPFVLTVRLFANMTAGHIVVIIFLFLIMMFQSYAVGVLSTAGALMIYMLEVLVAFIQAYVFVVLSSMFIGASVHSH